MLFRSSEEIGASGPRGGASIPRLRYQLQSQSRRGTQLEFVAVPEPELADGSPVEPDLAAGVQEDPVRPHVDAGVVGENFARVPQPERAIPARAEPDPGGVEFLDSPRLRAYKMMEPDAHSAPTSADFLD